MRFVFAAFEGAFLFLLSLSVYAGTESHGTRSSGDQNNPWFLGEGKKVVYCVFDFSDRFAEGEIDRMIQKAVENWRLFFQENGLDQRRFEPFDQMILTTPRLHSLPLVFQFERSQKPCTRFENGEDLIFVVGKRDGKAKEVVQSELKGWGQAFRLKYPYNQWWAKGIIWLSDIHRESQFRHLLLHELGHVFGMAHDSISVMDSNLGDYLLELPSSLFGNIESDRWKAFVNPGERLHLTNLDQCSGRVGFKKFESRALRLLQRLSGEEEDERIPGIVKDECFSVFLAKESGDRKSGTASWRLAIESLSGVHFFLQGEFEHPDAPLGPPLFARWLIDRGVENGLDRYAMEIETRYLHSAKNDLEGQGYFESKGMVFPATWHLGKRRSEKTSETSAFEYSGIQIQLFDPVEKVWTTL